MMMKVFWMIGSLLISLNQLQAQQATAQTRPTLQQQYDQLTWLTGTWNRVNMKPGRTAYEKWEKGKTNALQGIGVMRKGADSVITEKLQLVIKDSSIWYVADVPENKTPVWFRLTAISPDGFTAENPEHDFPATINYRAENDKLTVVIANKERSMTFNFVRQAP